MSDQVTIPQVTSFQKRLPPPYGRLSAEARLLIALRKSKMASRDDICRIMELKPIQVQRFWAAIKENKDGRDVIEKPMPAMFGEPIPGGNQLQCPYCRRWVTRLPCVTCCEESTDPWDDLGDVELCPPTQPTDAIPGTFRKIEVMAERVAAGLEPFCINDAVILD